jgi:hypothetical protein
MRYEFRQDVRNAAMLRAKYRCERCGERSNLQLHHRGDASDRSLFNAEVLCVECHESEHRARRLSARS